MSAPQELTRVVYRPGPQRRGGFSAVYHELLDLYMPHIGGFQGVGYYTLLLRLVNRDSRHAFAERAFPTKRFLKQAGGIGADRLKQIELQLVAWGLIDIQVERIAVRGRGGNQVTALKYTYWVNDPLPEAEFRAAVARGSLPRPVPEELLPSWWSPEVANRLGIPYGRPVPVPAQEQRNGFPVPQQEQRPKIAVPEQEQGIAVPAQEHPNRCSQTGTQEKQKDMTQKQKNVVVLSSTKQPTTIPQNRQPDDDDDSWAQTLMRAFHAVVGEPLPEPQARQLIVDYGFVQCLRQLRTLAWRMRQGRLERPMGYYLKALAGRYEVPHMSKRKSRHVQVRLELQALKARRRQEEVRERERRLREKLAKAEALLAMLPEEERKQIEAQARAALHERLRTDPPEPAVRMEMRLVALRRYGDDPAEA